MPSSDDLRLDVTGLDDARRALLAVPGKLRKKALARALREAGKIIQGGARTRAPVLQSPHPYRKAGTVKRRITVRASKEARRRGDVGVFINVRPLKGRAQVKRYGAASARNPNDPFYWRFLEFGTKHMAKRPFLKPAAEAHGNQAVQAFIRSVAPAIERFNR